MEAAIFSVTTPLFNNTSAKDLKSQQLDRTGKQEFFQGGSVAINYMSSVDALLNPLMKDSCGFGVVNRA